MISISYINYMEVKKWKAEIIAQDVEIAHVHVVQMDHMIVVDIKFTQLVKGGL